MTVQTESSDTVKTPRMLVGLRVLLAEDSWHIAQAIKMLLETEGASVLGPAPTVSEAERLANSAQSDVAVVDINLGGVMAFDLIDKLGEKGLPVVVISGYELPAGLREKVFAALQKPFGLDVLVRTLSRLQIAR